MFEALGPVSVVVIIFVMLLVTSLKVIKEYERAVVFRLGRLLPTAKGPGIFIIFPVIDRWVRVNLRLIAMDVPTQDVITKDNVSVKVNAVVYFRVVDPNRAITAVDDYLYATSQLAQTTLRSILGMAELDQLLSDREQINEKLQIILDQHTDPWGIKVSSVEVKHVDLPQEMQRAMAKQAEAERERRAKIISGRGGIPGRGEDGPGRGAHGGTPHITTAPVSPDLLRDSHGEQLCHHFPASHGPSQRLNEKA